MRGLAEQYRARGIRQLVAVIGERSGPYGDPDSVYLLADPGFRKLAGNLSAWPREASGRRSRLGGNCGDARERRGSARQHPRPHLRPAGRLSAARRPRPARPRGLRGPDPRIPRRRARHHAGPGAARRPRHEPADAAPGRCRARDRPAHRARRSLAAHAGHGRGRRVRPPLGHGQRNAGRDRDADDGPAHGDRQRRARSAQPAHPAQVQTGARAPRGAGGRVTGTAPPSNARSPRPTPSCAPSPR